MFYLLKQEEKRIKTIIIAQVTTYNNNETLRYMTFHVFIKFPTFHLFCYRFWISQKILGLVC